jgi:hypothetical protein
MIEKKTMGYVNFEYPGVEAKAVPVFVDSEKDEVLLCNPYDDDDEWYKPSEKEHFYPTVDEANLAIKKLRQEMFNMMGQVRDYIEAMNNWLGSEGEDSPLHFTEEDYLPYRNRAQTTHSSYYEKEYRRVDKMNDYLIDIIRTGFINIIGNSFKVEDVRHIKWGKNRAEVILTDDRTIETCSGAEFSIIKILFGKNNSNFTYRRLDAVPKDEE